jgi:hypothetical protein
MYNLKLSRRLNSIKSSREHSRVNWLQEETDVSGTDGSRNFDFFLQLIDAAVCPRRFYGVLKLKHQFALLSTDVNILRTCTGFCKLICLRNEN